MFDYLPIAAVVENKYFCIHGGLSPLIQNVEDINFIQRFGDIPTEVKFVLVNKKKGPFADLMWSDPETTKDGFSLSIR